MSKLYKVLESTVRKHTEYFVFYSSPCQAYCFVSRNLAHRRTQYCLVVHHRRSFSKTLLRETLWRKHLFCLMPLASNVHLKVGLWSGVHAVVPNPYFRWRRRPYRAVRARTPAPVLEGGRAALRAVEPPRTDARARRVAKPHLRSHIEGIRARVEGGHT